MLASASDSSDNCLNCLDPSEGPCIVHRKHVKDKKVSSMAVATLPEGLSIREVPKSGGKSITTNIEIPKTTVYGPLVGILLKSRDTGRKSHFAIGSKEEGFLDYWLDSDEVCNWMKFVRFARNAGEQNLIAYQQNREIYFATIRDVKEGEELKVWYSKSYGKDLGYAELPPGKPIVVAPPDAGRKKKYKSRFKFICEFCQSAFRSETLLTLHISTHGVALPEDLANSHDCPSCDAQFTSTNLLVSHVMRHKQPTADPEPYKCSKCVRTFSTSKGLTQHVRISHTGKETGRPAMVECEVCHKSIQAGAPFFSHWKGHAGTEAYHCPACLLAFGSPIELHNHAETHCVDGQFPCRICGKKFDKFTSLGSHLRKFHAEKKIVCSVCGLTFGTKHNLKVHMLVHFPRFDYQCEHCGQQFKHPHNYTRHIDRMHNPNKPTSQKHRKVRVFDGVNNPRSSRDYMSFTYKCIPCQLGFIQKRYYVKHLETRHPDVDMHSIPELMLPMARVDMFPCELCKKNFYSQAGLNTHLQKDHGTDTVAELVDEAAVNTDEIQQRKTALLYLCTVCDMRLISAAKLVKHTQNRHPEVNLMNMV